MGSAPYFFVVASLKFLKCDLKKCVRLLAENMPEFYKEHNTFFFHTHEN